MPSDREIISTRSFNAPRALVFKAWTDPEHLKLWWGPKGFINTFYQFDCIPGGLWKYTMHGPDDKEYYNECTFVEIVPDERIIFDHITEHRYTATAVFEEHQNSTLLTWSMVMESKTEFEKVKRFIMIGNEQNLDRLEAHLRTMI